MSSSPPYSAAFLPLFFSFIEFRVSTARSRNTYAAHGRWYHANG
jgi:hypothetical protein